MTTSTSIEIYLQQENIVKIENKNGTGDLFTFYQNQENGSLQLLVNESQLNKEYIYSAQISNGLNELSRGEESESYIFYIKKYYNKLQFIKPNISFYFDKNSNLYKSSDANISDAVFASVEILAKDEENGEYLIDFTNLILSETFSNMDLGTLSSTDSIIESVQSFPKNTNIKTKYVYTNSNNKKFSSKEVADSKVFSIKVFHTFMDLPDGYKPRMDDPRVGYFTTETNDMTTTKPVNYRDFIHRWRLIKKDPNAAISEPETPITWWIENSTPLEWRQTIKEGVLVWNVAFEKAGFKNAIEVKEQPNDADWNADDVRYNVLCWTSSPNPQFIGYAPFIVNPKTGEIIGADIMLEFSMFIDTQRYDELYDASLSKRNKSCKCSAMKHAKQSLQLGNAVLRVTSASEYELTRLQKEFMKGVVMHEIGHTLGLTHNMKASQLFTPEQLADKDFIEGKALSGSIMDYMAINITNDRSKQGEYYSTNIGPYDIWAIQYGYTQFKDDESEKNELLFLLNKSTLPELAFGNDDMRDPGKGIDPRVMLYDLSSDAITYSINRIKFVNKLMKNIKNKYMINGEWYQGLVNAYDILNKEKFKAGQVISRYIGGVYVERATIGQEGATKPYTPVPLKEQKRAMCALYKYIFSPKAMHIQKNFYNYLAKQRRGDNFVNNSDDPKIHSAILNEQTIILQHILHPNTLQRILDSELYGNQYKLATFMNDLNDIMFKDDVNKNINSFRRNLQLAYVSTLIKMFTEINELSSTSKSMAYYNLSKIITWIIKYKDSGDLESNAHKKYLKRLISKFL
jgi:hypothetical protein